VDTLEPPDTHYLAAALGWLELGNPHEAKAELAKISSDNAHHPDVLEISWRVFAEQNNWEAALGVARSLVQHYPQNANGWLHQAYSLRRTPDGGLAAAWEALLPAADGFPQEPTIPYNLACYSCQLGNMEEARKWFRIALDRGDKSRLKWMALNDGDLKPLWEEIRQL